MTNPTLRISRPNIISDYSLSEYITDIYCSIFDHKYYGNYAFQPLFSWEPRICMHLSLFDQVKHNNELMSYLKFVSAATLDV